MLYIVLLIVVCTWILIYALCKVSGNISKREDYEEIKDRFKPKS